MMLQNLTDCNEPLLKRILMQAARLAGADPKGVLVRVGQARDLRIRGFAKCTRSAYLRDWTATVEDYYTRNPGEKPVPVNGGVMYVQMPGWRKVHACRRELFPSTNGLTWAESFFWLCFHEWFHIREFQEELRGDRKTWAGGRRRANHAKRPEEIRVANATYEAQQKPLAKTTQDCIIELAMWLEEQEDRT